MTTTATDTSIGLNGKTKRQTTWKQEILKNIPIQDYYIPISIVVPAYNEEVTVVETVRSLLALEYKLWGIEQARAAKEQGFACGLYHIVGLFMQALTLLGSPVNAQCTARFYKNLPQDVQRICENLELLGDTVSNRTKLELLPFVKDVEAEQRRLETEKGA